MGQRLNAICVTQGRAWAGGITTTPAGPVALGATLDQLRGICQGDQDALDAIDKAIGSHQGKRNDLVSNRHEVEHEKRPAGTTSARALRRLRKDRPDLHARVLAGDLTPHAAMVEAGFRPKTMTVPTDLEALADYLRRRLSDDDRERLAVLLVDVEP